MRSLKAKKNQKGFSLIELMMVVVIIGVLAGVGIPQYQKFQMKARQSEVKSLLSGMYLAQKTFFSEWNQYYGDFNAVGYGLDGTLGYHMTFGAAGPVLGPAAHPNLVYRGNAAPVWRATQFCGGPNTCVVNAGVAANQAVAGAGIPAGGLTFDFGGVANIDSDPNLDTWRIDETKTFTQVTDDIAL